MPPKRNSDRLKQAYKLQTIKTRAKPAPPNMTGEDINEQESSIRRMIKEELKSEEPEETQLENIRVKFPKLKINRNSMTNAKIKEIFASEGLVIDLNISNNNYYSIRRGDIDFKLSPEELSDFEDSKSADIAPIEDDEFDRYDMNMDLLISKTLTPVEFNNILTKIGDEALNDPQKVIDELTNRSKNNFTDLERRLINKFKKKYIIKPPESIAPIERKLIKPVHVISPKHSENFINAMMDLSKIVHDKHKMKLYIDALDPNTVDVSTIKKIYNYISPNPPIYKVPTELKYIKPPPSSISNIIYPVDAKIQQDDYIPVQEHRRMAVSSLEEEPKEQPYETQRADEQTMDIKHTEPDIDEELKIHNTSEGNHDNAQGGNGDTFREVDLNYRDIESDDESPFNFNGIFDEEVDMAEILRQDTERNYRESSERKNKEYEDYVRRNVLPSTERKLGSDITDRPNALGDLGGTNGDAPEDIGRDDYLRGMLDEKDERDEKFPDPSAGVLPIDALNDPDEDYKSLGGGLTKDAMVQTVINTRRARARGEKKQYPKLGQSVKPYRTSTKTLRQTQKEELKPSMRDGRYTQVNLVRTDALNHLRSITELLPSL